MGTMLKILTAHYTPPVESLLGDKLTTLMASADNVAKLTVGAAPGNAYLLLTGTPQNIRIQRVGFAWGADRLAGSIGFSIVKQGQPTPASPQYTISGGANLAKGAMVYTNITPVEFNTAQDCIVIYNSLAVDWRAGMFASSNQPSAEWIGMIHCGVTGNGASSFSASAVQRYGSRFVVDVCGTEI